MLFAQDVTCDYQIDMITTTHICTRTNVLNNLNIDINIASVSDNATYSLVLNARRILNCNISVTASSQPTQFSLAQSLNLKEITDLSYKIYFTANNSNSVIHAIAPISRQTIEISDILILFDFAKAQSVDIINTIKGDLRLLNSIIDCKQTIQLQQFYLVQNAATLNCSWDQFNITVTNSSENNTGYGFAKQLSSFLMDGVQYYGYISQFESCYLAAETVSSSINIQNVVYQIKVIDKYHATYPAFTNSQITNVTLNNGSGYINMSFANWINNQTDSLNYSNLDNFNQITLSNFANNSLDNVLFNNSQIQLQSKLSIYYSNRLYGLTSSKTQFYNVTLSGSITLNSTQSYEFSLLSTKSSIDNLNARYITFNININNNGSNSKMYLIAKQINISENAIILSDITVNGNIISKGIYYGLFYKIELQQNDTKHTIQNINIIHNQVNVASQSSLFAQHIVLGQTNQTQTIIFDKITLNAPNITLETEGNFSMFVYNFSIKNFQFINSNIQYDFISQQYGNYIAFITTTDGVKTSKIKKFKNNIFKINNKFQNLTKQGCVFNKNIEFDQDEIQNNTVTLNINYVPYVQKILRHKFQFEQNVKCMGKNTNKFYYLLVSPYQTYSSQSSVSIGEKDYEYYDDLTTSDKKSSLWYNILLQDIIAQCSDKFSYPGGTYFWGNAELQDQEAYTISTGIGFAAKYNLVSDSFYQDYLTVDAKCKTNLDQTEQTCKQLSDDDKSKTGQIEETFK